MMRRRLQRNATALALLCTMAACSGAPRTDLQPGEVPPADSVEAGLWMQGDRAEAALRSSGRVIDDPELQAYVQDLACRLAGPHCPAVRVYVVRQPYFNATMMPNGTMAVWSGLLLRCENEDQLATVVGHEIGHYLRRHQVQHWETMRNSLTAAQLFGVVTAGLGVPLGGFAMLGAYGHVMAYGRDLEREADALGFQAMTEQGYDPQQASRIWQNLIAERDAAEEDAPDPFFASHPPSEERMRTLAEMAKAAPATASRTSDDSRFHALVTRHRATWLEDEIDLGHYKKLQVVLDRLKLSGQSPGIVWHYQGEVLRRDAEVEDKSEAIAAYRKALAFADAPAVTHRSLALLLDRQGDDAGAHAAYEAYLAAAPDAHDQNMIRYYMKNLETQP